MFQHLVRFEESRLDEARHKDRISIDVMMEGGGRQRGWAGVVLVQDDAAAVRVSARPDSPVQSTKKHAERACRRRSLSEET